MSDIVLGELPSCQIDRDAIHVAIIQMVASEMLRPGQRVGIVSEGIAGPSSDVVGIVDPYLTDVVPKGQPFWMCLLPGTVTGMRHHWKHSSFPENPVKKEVKPVSDDKAKAIAEEWLRSYAIRQNSYDDSNEVAFNRLIEGLCTEELFFNGSDLHGLYDLDDADELQKHAEAYLGKRIDFGRFSFSCSC